MEYLNVFNRNYVDVAKRQEIFPVFKVEVLDHSENVIKEITNDLSSESGSISVNYSQGVRRSCSITIEDTSGVYLPNPNTGLFWINRKFKIYVGLKDVFTDDIYWFSQGVFFTKNPNVTHNYSGGTVTIEGVDKFGVFGSELGYNQTEGTYVIKAGTNAYSAIRDILMMEMGNGNVIDPIEPILDPKFNNEVLPYDIIKSPESYISEILIEIANVLGCDIFYDTDGRLNLQSGTTDISYSLQSSIWDFSDVLPEYSDSSLLFNYVDSINTVQVTGENINGGVFSYTAENNNPLSSTRIELIGRKIKPITSTTIYNLDRAKDYSEYLLNRLSVIQKSVNFKSSFLPHLDCNKVVNVSDKYYKFNNERFIVLSLNIPLSYSGQMDVSTNNIADLPYYQSVST